jgi:hypothetical protein
MLMPVPATPSAHTVPGPLTADDAAELFCVIAKHERLRILGLALATRSVTLDELEAVGVGDHDALIGHLRALAAEGILEVSDDDGVLRIAVRSPYLRQFVEATRAWMTDLRGGPLVVE